MLYHNNNLVRCFCINRQVMSRKPFSRIVQYVHFGMNVHPLPIFLVLFAFWAAGDDFLWAPDVLALLVARLQ